jgi:CRP-like cAMP-binding protein
MTQSTFSQINLLLRSLGPDSYGRLAPHLERVHLDVRTPVERPGAPTEFVYFYETAIGSTVARAGDEEVEIGLCGREGSNGIALINGSVKPSFETFIQQAGNALRVPASIFVGLMAEDDGLAGLMRRSVQAFLVQVSYTSLANGRFALLERMARSLLMCHDRVVGNEINLTHSFLSLMLGVRRAGVTTDMHVLEGAHAVLNQRGRIIIRDRAKLESFAGGSYGVPEAEYERLIGQRLRRTVSD